MDLKQISYIITIAKTGNMTKAAQKIHISQSALSQCYHNIESELGITLFQKDGRNIRLTDTGVLFCEKGAELLEHATEFRNIMEQQKYKSLETLNYYTDVVDNCDETILQYQAFFPNIQFERCYCSEDQSILLLKNRSIDFALTLNRLNDVELHSECLIDEPVVALLCTDSSLAQKETISISELGGQTLTIYQNAGHLKSLFLSFFAQAGVSPSRILELYDPVLQIKQNNGFIFMPESTYHSFLSRGILDHCTGRLVTDSFCRRRVFLTFYKRHIPNVVCQSYFSYLRDYHSVSQKEHALPDLDRFFAGEKYQLNLKES
ncbi:MAG: LysR family transcriptional regulator [Lachnospiraceae bacterium]|nr:LysR family transcriptional regulator [Lachnospiraceae bacterium]